MYLDKAMPSKSVFSLLHDKRGGPPHCFSILPKISQQLPSELTVRRRLKWASHVERMGDEKLTGIRNPERGRKKEARKNENLMG